MNILKWPKLQLDTDYKGVTGATLQEGLKYVSIFDK